MPEIGSVVADPDQDTDDTLVVVQTHTVRADNFSLNDLDDGATVASYTANEPYPDDTHVVEVAFLNALQESYVRENVDSIAELREYLDDGGFQLYPYPAARLGKSDEQPILPSVTRTTPSKNRATNKSTEPDNTDLNADDLLSKAMGQTN
ncbi:hypothetical protein [Salinibaculum rarum]|uniref:hypothetical protein n=1 Tax=Salinibaculum rarum TaxID=3058903 RepID=UPI00266034F0|nr:hypothetical protein [Salinibaculum sp. KK48]